jgi:RNA 3'-terminal phosphate cyclase (ATP)
VITLDGSIGEGGGQVLRTALALSLTTGEALRVHSIRAGRRKPGLRRQHLTALHAAAEIGRAEVGGDAVGSQEISFRPHALRGGDYRFDIGTAGSASLVLQTVLPALLRADAPSDLTLAGGTHNPLAPPFEFLAEAFVPLLARLGATVEVRLERHGFFPAGGGRLRVRVEPCERLGSLDLCERGEVLACGGEFLVAALPRSIAERERRTVRQRTGWSHDRLRIRKVPDDQGPGNAVLLRVESENVTEVFSSFGRRGVRAETVATHAADEAVAYVRAEVPVGPHLADQLLLPLALGEGGVFRTTDPTPHTTTNAEVLRLVLGTRIDITPVGANAHEVRIGP